MASHVLCDCDARAALKYRHVGRHFPKLGDFADISLRQQKYSVMLPNI